jgi:hypothetical protein
MTISIDIGGCYTEHKEYFDAMAISMQKAGHRIGIITGEREADRAKLMGMLGFTPDFMHLWGEFETIINGNNWKVSRLLKEGVALHFDDDATEMKKYTDLWIVKVMNSGQIAKF